MLNRCEFIGHIGQKPEVKTLDSGVKVATFSIAVTKRGYTLANGTTIPEKTTWVRIIAWRGLGDIIERFTDKGSHVYVAGELNIRSYEKDGVNRDVVEVVAETIELLSKKPEGQQQQSEGETQRGPYVAPGQSEDPNQDLPF